ncbi:MAG: hypothetical protein GXO78_05435 [Calditrichaeota bacterium]|nr:hypothetical protein [Calditrichota bacterium]
MLANNPENLWNGISDRWVYAVILFLGILFFYPSLHIDFLSDNIRHILSARDELGNLRARYYRPVVVGTLWLDFLIWGPRSMGYHLTNLIFHLINTLLVFHLGKQIFRQRWVASGAAFLFLLLPIHGISIFWISGRTDLIMTTFYLLSLLTFIQWHEEKRPFLRAISLLAFGLALLSKEMAVSLPMVLVGFLLLQADRPLGAFRSALIRTAPYWGLLGAFFAFRIAMVGKMAVVNPEHAVLNPVAWGKHLAIYFGLLVIPGFHREIAEVFGRYPALLAVATMGSLGVLLWLVRTFYRDRQMLFALGFLLLTLLPVIRLVMRWYLYLPSVGFCLLVARVIWKILQSRRRWLFGVALALVVIVYAGFLHAEQSRWISAGQLAQDFSDAVCQLVTTRQLPGVLFTYVPAELQEVPVFMYGMLKYLNFKLKYVFHHPDTIRVGILSHLSMQHPIAFPWLNYSPDVPDRLSLTVRPGEAFFIFPANRDIWTGKRHPVIGDWVNDDYGRVKIQQLDELGRVTAVQIRITDLTLPLVHWDGGAMRLLRPALRDNGLSGTKKNRN